MVRKRTTTTKSLTPTKCRNAVLAFYDRFEPGSGHVAWLGLKTLNDTHTACVHVMIEQDVTVNQYP